ncbi:acetyl-CoA C-acyltransferase [Glutamicibacter sp. M10]|uniref:acetyl-CoA C-acyltransferase n=1 Tax=Glutamicibacter sp. M10 TaxID=3023076 RepID=UPI0021C5E48D|nr:acetyl-CoA C-acyltransferase [Glutamicibacter sp. M10]UXN32853.1 acetyl-CoA C-acyltransferase [Glutamicibacter sp. M10]
MSAKIVGYARTPFVKFNGVFANVPATELGAHAAKAALERAGVDPKEVEQVIVGQVLQGAAGQNPARQSAVGAGIPLNVPSIAVNAVCLSGAEAVVAGARLINSGEADVVLAIGQESMTLAPHAQRARAGVKYGAIEMIDTMAHDGLTDAAEKRSMGASTEEHNGELSITRESQDKIAAQSHQKAAVSREFTAGEIAPFTVTTRKGETTYSEDDGIRDTTTVETLAKLRPSFAKDGTITAGNSSQITDGAAAVVLASDAAIKRLGLTASAEIVSHAFVAGPGRTLHEQPSNAIAAALQKAGEKAENLKAVEINEAFTAVVVESTKLLGINESIVNQHGGATALGHPIGASGARIIGTLARQLQELPAGSLGAIGICGGGGQGTAVLLRSL